MNALRRRWQALPLLPRFLVAGVVALLAAGGLLEALAPAGLSPGAVLALGGGALLALGAWQLRGLVRSLEALAREADTLRRDDAPPEAHFGLPEGPAELRRLGQALRRTVDAFRQRQQQLLARNLALGAQLETRTHELSTLQDLSVGLASHAELPELVDDTLGALEQTLAFSSASVWAREGLAPRAPVVLLGWRASEAAAPLAGDDPTGMRLPRSHLQRYEQIERDGRPVVENRARQSLLSWLWSFVTDDSRSAALYRATRAWMAVPLKFRDEVLGVLRVDHQEDDYFSPERERLLTAVGSQAALAMRYTQLHAQERELAVMAERNRLARDLHDAVSQTLFAANLVAAGLLRRLERAAPDSAEAALQREVASLERLNRGALAEMRLLMFELRPDAMERAALADLLQHGIEAARCRGELNLQAHLDRHDGLPAAVRLQVYRIAQEALTNLLRHSQAREAVVEWRVKAPGVATLRVADDGVGFDPGALPPGHFGVEGMRSRAAEIGARLTLVSAPGEGSELRLELGAEPVPAAVDTAADTAADDGLPMPAAPPEAGRPSGPPDLSGLPPWAGAPG